MNCRWKTVIPLRRSALRHCLTAALLAAVYLAVSGPTAPVAGEEYPLSVPPPLPDFDRSGRAVFSSEEPDLVTAPAPQSAPGISTLTFGSSISDELKGHSVFSSSDTPPVTSVSSPVPAVPGTLGASSGTQFPYSTGFTQHTDTDSCSPYAPAVQYDPCVPQEEEPLCWKLTEGFLDALAAPADPMADCFASLLHSEHDEPATELNHQAIGIQPGVPRPPLVVETGEKFLGIGFLEQGVVMPTGAVWRPALWVFGTYRTGVNVFDSGAGRTITEYAHRLDLFSQLNLSGTERIVLGLRPLDEEEGAARDFTSHGFGGSSSHDGWNSDVQTLFFEGDFGEIFPGLDPLDTKALDIGFSVGRMPMSFQQGLLLNEDRIDALTITRNTLNGDGNLNLRATAVYAWNEINRNGITGGNIPDDGARLVGLFTESDFRHNTVNADIAYVWSDSGTDDLLVAGLSGIRRISGYHNTYNSSLHLLASFPTGNESAVAGQGELLFSQFSWTPHHTHDLVFLNTFWAIDQFTSAARGTLAGGPLGQAGLLFSAAGLGRYGAPLGNQASNVAGGSLGYQMFFDHTHEQVVFEIGGRQDTDGTDTAAGAAGLRYQKKLNQHWLVVVDGFVSKQEGRRIGQGGRVEMQMKF